MSAPIALSLLAPMPYMIAVKATPTRALNVGTSMVLTARPVGGTTWQAWGEMHRVNPSLTSGLVAAEYWADVVPRRSPGVAYEVRVTVLEPGQSAVDATLTHTTRALPGAAPAPTVTITSAAQAISVFSSPLAAGTHVRFADAEAPYDFPNGLNVNSQGTAGNPVWITAQTRRGVTLRLTGTPTTFRGLFGFTATSGGDVVIDGFNTEGYGVDTGTAAGISNGTAGVLGYFLHFAGTSVPERVTVRYCSGVGFDKFIGLHAPMNQLLVYENRIDGNLTHATLVNGDDSGWGWNHTGLVLAGESNSGWSNTISGHGDSMKATISSIPGVTKGLHWFGNEVLHGADDAFELDDALGWVVAERNTSRNTTTAGSADRIFAGPVYIVENVAINCARHPWKFTDTSQGIRRHNNTVMQTEKKTGHLSGMTISSSGTLHAYRDKNNVTLYGGAGTQMIAVNATLVDGFSISHNAYSHPSKSFQWGGAGRTQYASLTAALAASDARYAGSVSCGAAPFANPITLGATFATEYTGHVDVTLAGGNAAKNAGLAIDGWTDGFSGSMPDMGAHIAGVARGQVGASWALGSPAVPWQPSLGGAAQIGYASGAHPQGAPATMHDIRPAVQTWNPEAPGEGPWSRNGSGATTWPSITDYCAPVFVPSVRAYLQVFQAGHAAINVPSPHGFRLPTLDWAWLDYPPPTDGFDAAKDLNPPSGLVTALALSNAYAPALVDSAWGEWQGGHASFGAFARAGRIYTEGTHTYGFTTWVPGAAAGNTNGILVCPTSGGGALNGSTLPGGGHHFDLDTMRFVRNAGRRLDNTGTAGGACWAAGINRVVVIARDAGSDGHNLVDLFDPAPGARTWVRRTLPSGTRVTSESPAPRYHPPSGLVLVFVPVLSSGAISGGDVANSVRHDIWAAPEAGLLAGTASFTNLTVSATSWPLGRFAGLTATCSGKGWSDFVTAGGRNAFYSVNGVNGSTTLWRLKPPAGAVTQADHLTGTWTVTTETVSAPIVMHDKTGAADQQYLYQGPGWDSVSDCLIVMSSYPQDRPTAVRPAAP
jgi:hypothetical protein